MSCVTVKQNRVTAKQLDMKAVIISVTIFYPRKEKSKKKEQKQQNSLLGAAGVF